MGMEEKMERLEYALNPLDHSNHGNEDVLLTICENSQGSQDVVAPSSEDIQYEVRNADGVLQYRFVNNATENNPVNGNMNTQVGNTLQSTNCQFYVISDLSTSRPCLITPKSETETAPGCTRHLVVNSSKKRDEKRRATHNEVERRRRDKINQWIFKLKDLLPDSSGEQKNKNAMGDSKGEILIKACDYIKSMQQQVDSLKECLTQNETLRSENILLKEENRKLHEEKQHLLKLVGDKTDIKMESEIEFATS